MTKYQNAYFADLDKDDDDDLMTAQKGNDTAEGGGGDDDTPPTTASGSTDWEKRYSDLRRYSQQKEDQFNSRIEKLEEQLEQATKQQIKFPKTEEEIKAWSEKYPEVAAIVDSIARMRASEVAEETEKRLNKLREKEEASRKKSAYQELLELHPDFDEIKVTKEFQDWVSEQPQYIYDALYKNSTDARAAARAIDLYKVDTGNGKKRKKAAADNRDAARDVGSGSSSTPSGKGKAKWSDSKVKALSDKDYDKYEDEIMEAMRTGNYDYDLS